MFAAEAFFWNWYSLPVYIVSTMILLTGIFVFSQNRKSPTNISFFLFCLSLNLWLYGNGTVFNTTDTEVALKIYRRISFLGVSFIAPLVFTFSSLWLGRYEKQKVLVWTGLVLAPAFYLVCLLTPFGIPYVEKFFWGHYPHYGLPAQIFLLMFFSYFTLAFYNFFSEWRRVSDPFRKKQVKLTTIAFLISFTGSVDYISKVFPVAVYPFGYLSVFVWTIVVAYLIVRYRIMDIQTVIHKTIMWLIASSILGLPLVVFFHAAKDWLYALNDLAFWTIVYSSFVLVVLFTRHIQPRIDHLFQRRQWDLTKALERFNDELVHLKSLNEVVNHILNTVRNIFYAQRVSLLVRKEGSDAFMSPQDIMDGKTEGIFGIGNVFLAWLETHDEVVLEERMRMDPRFSLVSDEAREYFQSLQALVCVPLIVNRKLVGILNIGLKQNFKKYSPTELNFLSDLRRSASIALSNSLHIIAIQENLRKWNEELENKVTERTQQLKETQEQLVQAEKLATIGTLSGGIAHEINNPLTAVLTNAQILKMTANEEDLESITLIEEGAKRCQIIIQKLMKYSRKPMTPEKIGMVDVNAVVKNMAAFLNYQLQQDNIILKTESMVKMPEIEGSANELEQVFTNLILNAKDALLHKNSDREISVKTSEVNGSIYVSVVDNGSGIPEENLKKIFDPFFTTKDVGKGTGLGLAVTYGIVKKHGGKIEVKSEPGKGTDFTVVLPKTKKYDQGE